MPLTKNTLQSKSFSDRDQTKEIKELNTMLVVHFLKKLFKNLLALNK